jgi:hypothetical protein
VKAKILSKIKPPTVVSRRFTRYLIGFSVGVGIGAAPFLGAVNVPGFTALLNTLPFQIRVNLVALSAFFMGVVVVAVQFYSAEELSLSALRRLFAVALAIVVVGFVLFFVFHELFTTPVMRGSKQLAFLIGPSRLPASRGCDCDENVADQTCIRGLSFKPDAIASCWEADSLRRRGLLLRLSYLLLTGGFGILVGLVVLKEEERRRRQKADNQKSARRPPQSKANAQAQQGERASAKSKAAPETKPGLNSGASDASGPPLE